MPSSWAASSSASMTVTAPLPRPVAAQHPHPHPHPNHGLNLKQALNSSTNTNTDTSNSNNMAVTWRHTIVQVWSQSRAVPLLVVFAPSEGGPDPVSTTVAVAHMHMLDHHHQSQLTLSTTNANAAPPAAGPVAGNHVMLAAIVSTSSSHTPTAAADWSPPLCARNMSLPGLHHAVPLPRGTQCVRVEYWPVTANVNANANANGHITGHQDQGNSNHAPGPAKSPLKCAQNTPVHVILISVGPAPPCSSSSSSTATDMLPPSHAPVHAHPKPVVAAASSSSSLSSDTTVFIRPTTPASALNAARRTHANMQLARSSPYSPRPPSPKAPNVLLSRDAYVLNRRAVPLPMIPPSMLGHATWVPPPLGAMARPPVLKMIADHSTGSGHGADTACEQQDESLGAAGQIVALNPDAPYWSRAGGGNWRPWSVSPHPSAVHSFEADPECGGSGTLFSSEHEYAQAMTVAMAGASAHESEGKVPTDEDLAMFQRYLMASQEPSEMPAPVPRPQPFSSSSSSSRDVVSLSASASTVSPRVKQPGYRAFPPPSSATPNGSPVGSSMNATPPNPSASAFGSPAGADTAYQQFADEKHQHQHQQPQPQPPRFRWVEQQVQQQYNYPPPSVSAASSPSMGNEFGGSTRRQAQANRYRPYPSFSGPRPAGVVQAMQH